MTDPEKRKGGGAKLSRTETVTVRLDPKLRYLAELAARKQRRTLSSYIEWAIEDSLKSVLLSAECAPGAGSAISLADEAGLLWDVDDAERFVRLAIHHPDLLNHQEQEVWKLLQDSFLLLPAQVRSPDGRAAWDAEVLERQVYRKVREHWPSMMMAHAEGRTAREKWLEFIQGKMADGLVYGDAQVTRSGVSENPNGPVVARTL